MWAGALLLALLLGPASGAAPSGVCDVTQPPYSARCDNATDAAPAIQRALDDPACAAVLIAAPLPCVSRALNLTAMSGRALLIAPGSELAAWRDPRTYSLTAHNSMFLSATDGDGAWTGPHVRGFTLAGGGRIVGGGRAWWPLGESVVRPRTLWLPNCSDILISNLTIVDSPAWNLGLRGNSVTVSSVRVESGHGCGGYGEAPNTDGVNFGGHGLRVLDLWVRNGDDCIPITTGNDGSTSDVLVQGAHCECGVRWRGSRAVRGGRNPARPPPSPPPPPPLAHSPTSPLPPPPCTRAAPADQWRRDFQPGRHGARRGV
jgi:polygalacturonase